MQEAKQNEIEIGKIIQATVYAAREHKAKRTSENERKYSDQFERLYDFTYQTVYAKITQISQWSEGQVEDLCQDIILEVWKTLHRFE